MVHAVLAENLKLLMKAADPPMSARGLAAAAKVDGKTVGRILAQQNSPTLESLQAIAAVFDLLPWQLLVPGLDPADPPFTRLTKAEAMVYERAKRIATDLGSLPSPRP
jgi:transcriptional regulator with XRE-family HTH domain